MKCKYCGVILDEDSVFCTNCGKKVDAEQTELFDAGASEIVSGKQVKNISESEKSEQNPIKEKLTGMPKAKLISLLIGTALMIIGIVVIIGAGTSVSSASFGGDYQTYTYNAIVEVAEQLSSVNSALGCVIVAIGACIDVRVWLD